MMKPRFTLVTRSAIIAAVVVVLLLLWLVVLPALRRPAAPVRPAVIVTPVVTAPVREGSIVRTVVIAGTIDAARETQLAARAPARVLEVTVQQGDRVSRGELLARLDDRDARAALDAAEAGVQAAEAALAKAKAGAAVQNTQAATNVTTAEAAVAAAQAKLQQARGATQAAADEAAAEMRRAQAALDTAQANLATATRGARPAQLQQAQAVVAQAQAAADAARQGLSESQFLYDRGGLTRAQLDEARTANETAQAQLKSAQAALQLARGGASPEERQAAEAGVRQAQAGVEAARAGARRAQLAQQDAAAALAQLRQAQAGLRAARAAHQGSSVARDDVRSAAAALDQGRVQRRQAQDQVAATRLISPVDGVVTLRAVDPGQIAQPGQPLITIASGALYLAAPVSALTVTVLRPGQPVTVTSESEPGDQFPAVLTDVPSVPGPDGRTYPVRARLAGGSQAPEKAAGARRSAPGPAKSPRLPQASGAWRPESSLAPGARARGVVQVARATNTLLVPPAAVHRTSDGTVVWVARQGRAQRLSVTTGIETDAAVQILAGVKEGEEVIISGAEGLRPGAAVDAGQRESERPGIRDGGSFPELLTPDPSLLPPGAQRSWA